MTDAPAQDVRNRLRVRGYRPKDQPAIEYLYARGLLTGHISPNDTGADIENIPEGYLCDPGNGFWVAEIAGQVVGMVGVAGEGGQTAEIRRLRVAPGWQRFPMVAEQLVRTALDHCRRIGYLKVVLDTRLQLQTVDTLFTRFGFQFTRTKMVQGKELPEFYLDLYRPTKHKDLGAGI